MSPQMCHYGLLEPTISVLISTVHTRAARSLAPLPSTVSPLWVIAFVALGETRQQ